MSPPWHLVVTTVQFYTTTVMFCRDVERNRAKKMPKRVHVCAPVGIGPQVISWGAMLSVHLLALPAVAVFTLEAKPPSP
jgi:hypothetical protein